MVTAAPLYWAGIESEADLAMGPPDIDKTTLLAVNAGEYEAVVKASVADVLHVIPSVDMYDWLPLARRKKTEPVQKPPFCMVGGFKPEDHVAPWSVL